MTKRRRLAIAVPLLLLLVALAVLLIRRGGKDDGLLLASGTVEATEARLGFQAVGRLESVAVQEGEAVRAGQELAALDRREPRARLEAAQAQAAAARALLAELEAGARPEELAQAQAALAAARDREADARRDAERVARLHAGGAVSQEADDKARLAVDLAASQAEQAAQQLALLRAGARPERLAAQRALVEQAEAAARALEAGLATMAIQAPIAGVVTLRHREPGEIVALGSPVISLMDPRDRWVRIFVPETRVGALRLGQRAEIRGDSFPDRRYEGEVVMIASEAEFTPRSVQTTEERVKLVYAVKVRILGDETGDLKPGMPADLRLDLEPR